MIIIPIKPVTKAVTQVVQVAQVVMTVSSLSIWSLMSLGLTSGLALADVQRLPWRLHRQHAGIWSLGIETQSFGTSANYGPSGDLVAPADFESLRRTEVAATFEAGIHPRLTLFGRGSWNITQVSSSTVNGHQMGLADQSIGLSLRLLDSKASIDFQVQADLPAYQNGNSPAQQDPFIFIGDASTNVHLGGFITLPLGQTWDLTGGSGFTLRTGQFSSAIPWSVSLSKSPDLAESGWIVRASGWGFASLATDPNAQDPNIASRQQGGGGSFLVNAVNPSLAVAQVDTGYRWGPEISATLAVSKTIWGQATAEGLGVHAGLQWNIDRIRGTSASSFRARKQDPKFVTYSGQGKVKAVSSTRTLLIDQGSQQGLSLGDRMDIFTLTPDGNLGQPVARGEVTQLDWDQAQLTLLEVYREVAIKEGFAVQKPVQP